MSLLRWLSRQSPPGGAQLRGELRGKPFLSSGSKENQSRSLQVGSRPVLGGSGLRMALLLPAYPEARLPGLSLLSSVPGAGHRDTTRGQLEPSEPRRRTVERKGETGTGGRWALSAAVRPTCAEDTWWVWGCGGLTFVLAWHWRVVSSNTGRRIAPGSGKPPREGWQQNESFLLHGPEAGCTPVSFLGCPRACRSQRGGRGTPPSVPAIRGRSSRRRRRQEQQNGFLGGASLWTLEGWMGKCRRRKAAADDLTKKRPKQGTLAAPLRLDRCLRGPLCGSSTRLPQGPTPPTGLHYRFPVGLLKAWGTREVE